MYKLHQILTILALGFEAECGLDRKCLDRETAALYHLSTYEEEAVFFDDYPLQDTIESCAKNNHPFATLTLDCVAKYYNHN